MKPSEHIILLGKYYKQDWTKQTLVKTARLFLESKFGNKYWSDVREFCKYFQDKSEII